MAEENIQQFKQKLFQNITDQKILNYQTQSYSQSVNTKKFPQSVKNLNSLLKNKLQNNIQIVQRNLSQNYIVNQQQQNPQLFKEILYQINEAAQQFAGEKVKLQAKQKVVNMGWEGVQKVTAENLESYNQQFQRNWTLSHEKLNSVLQNTRNSQNIKRLINLKMFDKNCYPAQNYVNNILSAPQIANFEQKIENMANQRDQINQQDLIQLNKSFDESEFQFVQFFDEFLYHIIKNKEIKEKFSQQDKIKQSLQYLERRFNKEFLFLNNTYNFIELHAEEMNQVLMKRFGLSSQIIESNTQLQDELYFGYVFLMIRAGISNFRILEQENCQQFNLKEMIINYHNNEIEKNRILYRQKLKYFQNTYFLQQIMNLLCKYSSIPHNAFITEDEDYIWNSLFVVQYENQQKLREDSENLSLREFQQILSDYLNDEEISIKDKIIYKILTLSYKSALNELAQYLKETKQEYQIIYVLYILLKFKLIDFNDQYHMPQFIKKIYCIFINKSNSKKLQSELQSVSNQIRVENIKQIDQQFQQEQLKRIDIIKNYQELQKQTNQNFERSIQIILQN